MNEASASANKGDGFGPSSAEQLLPVMYDELRRLAAFKMTQEAPGQTLQPTALVHEVWLRLSGGNGPRFHDRAHFFRVAAETMRRILIDRVRRRQRLRQGGGQERTDFDEFNLASQESDERLLQVHDALDRLERRASIAATAGTTASSTAVRPAVARTS